MWECEGTPVGEKQAGVGSVTMAPETCAGLQWPLRYKALGGWIRLVLSTRQSVRNKGQDPEWFIKWSNGKRNRVKIKIWEFEIWHGDCFSLRISKIVALFTGLVFFWQKSLQYTGKRVLFNFKSPCYVILKALCWFEVLKHSLWNVIDVLHTFKLRWNYTQFSLTEWNKFRTWTLPVNSPSPSLVQSYLMGNWCLLFFNSDCKF